jgi:signal transduction histidine kinase
MTALTTAAMPSALADSSALRRATGALLWVTLGVNVLFIVGLVAADGDNNPLVTVWLALACQWVPVSIFWLIAARTGFARVFVILAAAGVTFSAIGDTYYALAVDEDGYLAFPSPADPAYLLFYPLMVAALVSLTRHRLAGAGRLVVLETAVATVGASAVFALVLGPLMDDAMASGTVLESAVAIAYPLFDLILIAVIVGIMSVPTVKIGRRWWALLVGLGIFAAGDVAYALLEAEDAYVVGTLVDATWTVGLAFITWWVAGVVDPGAGRTSIPRRPIVVPLPAIAVLSGLAVLIVGTIIPVSAWAVVLAALTVALGAVPVIFRQQMLGRMLAAQEEAVRHLTALDQAKTDLLVTVNHEFRTPLTSINGHVELLLDADVSELPPWAIKALRTIERNGARLQRLIDDTFTASRFQGEDTVLEPSRVDVAGLVMRAVASVEPSAHDRNVTISVEFEDPALAVDADGAHLERALANLIDNAVKFTDPDGHVAVSVFGSATEGDAVIRVTDNGIGVPADDIPRLFTKFFRASNVQSAAIPGVGLGLAIAQQIVHAHGGTITVDSTLGQGTTMTVRLPVAPASREG